MKKLILLAVAVATIAIMSGCTSEVRGLVIVDDSDAVLESVAIDGTPVSFEKAEEGYYFYGNKPNYHYRVMFTLRDEKSFRYMLIYPDLKNSYRFYVGKIWVEYCGLSMYSVIKVEALYDM